MDTESLAQKIARVTSEEVSITEYNPQWPQLFDHEKAHLINDLPAGLILRIEHFGSTAVPGLCAKPIVDIAIEISDVEYGKAAIPQILEPQGYDCFWRPIGNQNEPPYFTWCIGRTATGERQYHLHFVETSFKDREILFRDVLRKFPETAKQYGKLKRKLSEEYKNNRIAYTDAKGEFINGVIEKYGELIKNQ